ncbi:MAG: metalloregulator ArsR/SmtB family transcription factor [Clostridium sp.]|uniref:ArsR/SmtB family transcription factor n=1 Tax=Clostridium sp. 3-3 TaxID=2070757 RepID=UPI0005C514FE|nr:MULTISPECIES: metalloregulator ArsR/SmtB family transcription factor [Clostridium]MDU1402978.1 metalloregulator ArsR/SmtB family transcription factor [Clostridium sp.]MDU4926994.1 metalloregulator ArsR/SmtB family transcription factor [Clostridium sp.]MDU6037508.1 metalloregulator ArsR/SmtB family transcription factor [Clostridium butyricum]QUF83701.1 helix-turn-helix transcriptional regulator [Clostridium butyricum]
MLICSEEVRILKEENTNIDNCSCNVIHENVVEMVKNALPQDEVLYDLAELFKAFGDSTRVKILCALFESEMCVCDLSAILGISQSAVSHQLRTLKASRLVKFKRVGKVVYYSLEDEHIKHIFNEGFKHIIE